MTRDDCEQNELPPQCAFRFKAIEDKLDMLIENQKTIAHRAWEIAKAAILIVVGAIIASFRTGKG